MSHSVRCNALVGQSGSMGVYCHLPAGHEGAHRSVFEPDVDRESVDAVMREHGIPKGIDVEQVVKRLDEARAEVERLREEVQAVRRNALDWQSSSVRLRAALREVERLRAELKVAESFVPRHQRVMYEEMRAAATASHRNQHNPR